MNENRNDGIINEWRRLVRECSSHKIIPERPISTEISNGNNMEINELGIGDEIHA